MTELALTLEGCRIGRFDLDPDLAADTNFDIVRDLLQTSTTKHGCPQLEAQTFHVDRGSFHANLIP